AALSGFRALLCRSGGSSCGIRRLLCTSSSGSGGSPATAYPVGATFVNRNPRSLEYSGHEPSRKAGSCSSRIVHNSGSVVVEASTDESAIRSQLYSPRDVSAARAVGEVLARRCIQCGIDRVHVDQLALPRTAERNDAFCQALLDGGVQLEERPELPRPERPGVDYDSLTAEQRAALFPRLVDELRTGEDKAKYVQYAPTMRPARHQERERRYQALAKVRRGWWWNYRHQRLLPSPNPNNPFARATSGGEKSG
uniref:Ribosomal_L18e/L15P domain-containing protein n=1 Tax=Macrostomum lignano TaxID=282301 RepID=A0A1I8H5U9_9PLAT